MKLLSSDVKPRAARQACGAPMRGGWLCLVAWVFGGVLLSVAPPASAQQRKVVDGIIVNLGIVTAEEAFGAEGHRESHSFTTAASARHVLITLDDQKSGSRIADAEVVVEITDPTGHVERKALLHTQAAGLPDYSEMFDFRSFGEYVVRVVITPQPGGKPIEAQFKTRRTG